MPDKAPNYAVERRSETQRDVYGYTGYAWDHREKVGSILETEHGFRARTYNHYYPTRVTPEDALNDLLS